jgi:parallel beta-helix repeat protein
VLVVGLLFAMLPGGKVEAATSVGTAAELTAALLTEETEITVTADISVGLVSGSAFVIPSGKTITLDLNGNEISAETSNGGVFGNAGTLTILDNSVDKGGKIINTNTTQTTTGEAAKSAISNTGVLIVNVGVIVAGPASGHGTWGDVNFNPAYGIDNLGGGQVTVNGATISGANGLRNFANGPDTKITINDGIVTGKTGIAMQSFGTNVGTLTINGDTIVTATRSAIYAAGVTQYNHIVINGGTFSGEDEYGTVCVVDGTLEINGGTFTGNNGTYSLLNYYAIVDVTAGTFNGDIWGGEFEPYEPYYEGIGLTTFAPSEGKCVTVDGEIGGNVVGEDLVNACHVHNMTQDTWHPTIQTAINEATAGDIIEVAAGTYVEQVTIDKSLSLIGAGELVTKIQAPATRTSTVVQVSTWDYIVAAYPTTGTIDVRIEGFTIDANSLPKQTGTAGLIGVFFRDVDGTTAGLFDSTVQRFEQVDYQSWGIRVYGDSALTIDGNILTGYTRDGITAIGDGGTGADPVVTISDNDLTGSALPLNGISILDGATGTVSGNTVRDHTRSAEWAAVGILVGDSENVQVSSNTVINSFYSIFLDSGADNNTVSGNTLTGTIKRGISLDKADNNVIKSNIINSLTIGTLDTAIGMDNDCANNVIGGELPADGNTITMATTGTGNLYAIYMQASVGANNNLIKNNTITGGARAVEFDGPPGITGSTTIANNVISGQSFGGILAYNNGDLIITGNSLTNTVRPMEFWGPVNLTVSGNTITGAVFDAINLGNVSGTTKLISGNTISGVAGNAIVGQPDADNFVIDGNTISTSNVGININTGCTGTIIRDNVIDDNIWSGISAYDALLTVTGNTITDSWRGIEILGALTAHQNIFTGNDYGSVIFYDNSAHNVTNNWWGSADGPGAWLSGVNVNTFNQGSQGDYIQANTYGNFVFAPWLDAAPPVGVSFAPVTNGTKSYGSIQAAIDDATDGDTILVCSGTYPGGLVVGPDNDNLTFELNGATVGAGSPAFTISGDNIVINGPGTLDGGTPGTDHAVLVSDGVSNFTINKVEIKNWVDGVHYAGEITNTQVVDCYIHDNTGDGVHFTTQPTVQTPVSFYIQGNMFKHNGGVGVYNAGTTTINTEYNSWSDYAGAAGLDDGDGATNADTDPFTHVDLYLVSTNPAVDNWPHQVFVEDTITYQVKAHLVNTTAAAFDLSYPSGLF